MFKKTELSKQSFLIAEVGQNHQGDLEIARKYIKFFAETGVDAIKFRLEIINIYFRNVHIIKSTIVKMRFQMFMAYTVKN